jgi:hypothetical protein
MDLTDQATTDDAAIPPSRRRWFAAYVVASIIGLCLIAMPRQP